MSEQRWDIHAPDGFAYTPDEVAQIVRAAQAFLTEVASIGGSGVIHLAMLHGIGVIDAQRPVTWPQPGDAVIQLAPCEICGFKDWPAGGMQAARDIHVRSCAGTRSGT